MFNWRDKFYFSWERFPALFIFASLLSGSMLFHGMCFPLFFALTHKEHSFKIGYLSLAIFTSLLYFFDFEKPPSLHRVPVKAYIEPIQIAKSEKQKYLFAYIPYLKTESGEEYKKLKCMIPLQEEMTSKINSSFVVEGIIKSSSYGCFLKPKKWEPVKNSFSLVGARFDLKKRAEEIIIKHVSDKDVCSYFCALTTGNVSDPFIKQRFLIGGMLHTLAISGFHFSWVIFLFSIPLCLLFKKKYALIILLILAWGYYAFIGPSASISRAWIGTSVYLITILFSKISLPLNALGLAGICSIVIDPYSPFTLSFSLSFLATFCLLTTHSYISSLTNKICAKRSKKILKKMPLLDKCGYHLLRLFLSAFFLTSSIQIILLPIFCLSFPFLSIWGLFYNIYFPLSMVPTILLLIFAFFFHLFTTPTFIWKLNEMYSKPFLETLLYGSGTSPLLLKLPNIQNWILCLFTCICIYLSLQKEKLAHEEYLLHLDEFLLT